MWDGRHGTETLRVAKSLINTLSIQISWEGLYISSLPAGNREPCLQILFSTPGSFRCEVPAAGSQPPLNLLGRVDSFCTEKPRLLHSCWLKDPPRSPGLSGRGRPHLSESFKIPLKRHKGYFLKINPGCSELVSCFLSLAPRGGNGHLTEAFVVTSSVAHRTWQHM